jgi:hypothetical protein
VRDCTKVLYSLVIIDYSLLIIELFQNPIPGGFVLPVLRSLLLPFSMQVPLRMPAAVAQLRHVFYGNTFCRR